MLGIVVCNAECDLLGRPEPGEEPELIIVALRLAPIPMERCNEPLGFLDVEGINHRPVFLADAGALEGDNGIALLRAIAIPELKRTPQCTDSVVVCFLFPRVGIGNLDQGRVPHAEKGERANGGAPDVIEALAMGGQGRRRQVALGDSCLFMPEERSIKERWFGVIRY